MSRHASSCTQAALLFCRGFLSVDDDLMGKDELYPDSYLDVAAWGKGIAFVNGFNLGYYWPLRGPANTMCER